jgi:hypothetical protein
MYRGFYTRPRANNDGVSRSEGMKLMDKQAEARLTILAASISASGFLQVEMDDRGGNAWDCRTKVP